MAHSNNPLRMAARHGPREYDADFEQDLLKEEVAVLSKKTMSTRSNKGIAKDKQFSDQASLALLCPDNDAASTASKMPDNANGTIAGRDHKNDSSMIGYAADNEAATANESAGTSQHVTTDDSTIDSQELPQEDTASSPKSVPATKDPRANVHQASHLKPTPTRTESPFSLQKLLDSLPAVPPNPLPNPDRRPQLPSQHPFVFKANKATVDQSTADQNISNNHNINRVTPKRTSPDQNITGGATNSQPTAKQNTSETSGPIEHRGSPLDPNRPFSLTDARHHIENLIKAISDQLDIWHRSFSMNIGEFNVRLTRQGFRNKVTVWTNELAHVSEFLERGILQKAWTIGMLWSVQDVRKILWVIKGMWLVLMDLGRGQSGLWFKEMIGREVGRIERALMAFEHGTTTVTPVSTAMAAKGAGHGPVKVAVVEMSDRNASLAQQAILAAEQKLGEDSIVSAAQPSIAAKDLDAALKGSGEVNTTAMKSEAKQLDPEASAFCPSSTSDRPPMGEAEGATIDCASQLSKLDGVASEPKERQTEGEIRGEENVGASSESGEYHDGEDRDEMEDGVLVSTAPHDCDATETFDSDVYEDDGEDEDGNKNEEEDGSSESDDDSDGGVALY